MAAGVTLNLPYTSELAAMSADLETAATQAKAFIKDLRKYTAEGHKLTPKLTEQLKLANKLVDRQKEVKRNDQAFKSTVRDAKLLNYYMQAQGVRNILSGNVSPADIAPLLQHEKVGRAMQAVGLGKFAGAASRVALPATIAAEITNAVFEKAINNQEVRKRAEALLIKNISTAQTIGASPLLRRSLERAFEAKSIQEGGLLGLVQTQASKWSRESSLGSYLNPQAALTKLFLDYVAPQFDKQQEEEVRKNVQSSLEEIGKGKKSVEGITGRSEDAIVQSAALSMGKTVGQLTNRERSEAIVNALAGAYTGDNLDKTKKRLTNLAARKRDEDFLRQRDIDSMTFDEQQRRAYLLDEIMSGRGASRSVSNTDNGLVTRAPYSDSYNVLLNTKKRSADMSAQTSNPSMGIFNAVPGLGQDITTPEPEAKTRTAARMVNGVWQMGNVKAARDWSLQEGADVDANSYAPKDIDSSKWAIKDRATPQAGPDGVFRIGRGMAVAAADTYKRTGPVSKD
jgi:hypothetical protein